MKFDLIIDGKYIAKTGLSFYYEGNLFNNERYFKSTKLFGKTVIYIKAVTELSPLFTKITFQKFRREQNQRLPAEQLEWADNRYEEFSLPYFVIYDDSALEIPNDIAASIASTGKDVSPFIKYSKFIESIVLYDPVLDNRISHAERMIQNAENVIVKQYEKISRIYSEYLVEKKEFKDYDDKLKFLLDDLNMVQEKLNTDLPNEPDGGLSKEQDKQA